MTGRKRVAALVGVFIFVALGAFAASRAQQPVRGAAPPELDRKALREQIVRLRTDVELLQLKHDAARSNLSDILKRQRHLAFVEATDMITPIGICGLQLATITGNANDSDGLNQAVAQVKVLDGKAGRELDEVAVEDVKKTGDRLRAAIEQETANFTDVTRQLHEKSMELAEAESRYGGSR